MPNPWQNKEIKLLFHKFTKKYGTSKPDEKAIVRGILDDVEKADYLLDAAVYPEWKQIQKKSPNDNLYDQLIQFVKFYQSDFGFDMSPLMTILEQEEIKEEFDKRLKNS